MEDWVARCRDRSFDVRELLEPGIAEYWRSLKPSDRPIDAEHNETKRVNFMHGRN